MAFVIDSSIGAAWLLPEEYSDAAEAMIATIGAPCPVQSLLFLEIRDILVTSECRGRTSSGGTQGNMECVRQLSLNDAGIGGDSHVLLLCVC